MHGKFCLITYRITFKLGIVIVVQILQPYCTKHLNQRIVTRNLM